jgi:hypothetical protein
VTLGHGGRGTWEWAACGASVTGSEHLRRGLGCDDAYGYAVMGDYVAAVVADGAGSVTGTSAWGSYAACQRVLQRAMAPSFVGHVRIADPAEAEDLMRWLFDGAIDEVAKEAEAIGVPVAQLATTLCIAVSTPELTIFGQIGDGIIASEKDEVIATHLIEEKSDYANATWFLQSEGAFEESFRVSVQAGLTAFALSTDGMTYKITDVATGQAYEPFFVGSWQHVRSGASAADFAALLRGIKDDQTGDDKTMVLAALQWVEDNYYPSPRPVCKTIVSSPPPPTNPSLPTPTAPAARRATMPDREPRRIVDHGTLLDMGDRAAPPVGVVAGLPGGAEVVRNGDAPQDLVTEVGGKRRLRRHSRHRRI